jgi:hypothetical protein
MMLMDEIGERPVLPDGNAGKEVFQHLHHEVDAGIELLRDELVEILFGDGVGSGESGQAEKRRCVVVQPSEIPALDLLDHDPDAPRVEVAEPLYQTSFFAVTHTFLVDVRHEDVIVPASLIPLNMFTTFAFSGLRSPDLHAVVLLFQQRPENGLEKPCVAGAFHPDE